MSSISNAARTDLVIGVTLAETFLLILFVTWQAFSEVIREDPVARLKEHVAQLEAKNEEIEKTLVEAKARIKDLEVRREFLLKYLRLPKDFDERKSGSGKDVEASIRNLCRSKPTCNSARNLLVEVSMIRGRTSIKVLAEDSILSHWMAGRGQRYPVAGVPISNTNAIESFLEGVRSYYASANVDGQQCRFDYRLRYVTGDDYRDGRERFERYFYPAGNTRVER